MDEDIKLSRAVSRGDCASVAQILAASSNGACLSEFALRELLDEAAAKGKLDIVELVLEHMQRAGMRVDCAMKGAAEAGDLAMVNRLLELGVRGDSGGALISAAKSGNAEIVRVLLRCGANVEGEGEMGPLHVAGSWGHEDIAQILLDNGADINAVKIWGTTPLGMAAECHQLAMMDMLLARGADIKLVSLARILSEYRQDVGMTLRGYHQYGRTLADTLASAGRKRASDARNLEAKYRSVMSKLIGVADITVRGEIDELPLHGATLFFHSDIVELLLARGSDVNALDENGATPLDWALSTQVDSIAKALIECGAVKGSGIAPALDGGCFGCGSMC